MARGSTRSGCSSASGCVLLLFPFYFRRFNLFCCSFRLCMLVGLEILQTNYREVGIKKPRILCKTAYCSHAVHGMLNLNAGVFLFLCVFLFFQMHCHKFRSANWRPMICTRHQLFFFKYSSTPELCLFCALCARWVPQRTARPRSARHRGRGLPARCVPFSSFKLSLVYWFSKFLGFAHPIRPSCQQEMLSGRSGFRT